MELLTPFLILLMQILASSYYVRCVSASALKNGSPVSREFVHTDEGRERGSPQIIKVHEMLYVSEGLNDMNTVFVLAPDGLLLIDMTEYHHTMAAFWKILPGVPVRAVIYTFSDIYTARLSVLDEVVRDSPDVQIYTNRPLDHRDLEAMTLVVPAIYRRAVKSGEWRMGPEQTTGGPMTQGGGGLGGETVRLTEETGKEWRVKVVTKKITDVNIAGLEIQFLQLPGPGCHLAVWIPSLRTIVPGRIVYPAYPDLYTLRGTEPRDPFAWIESLDSIRRLRPDILIPSHSEAIQGMDAVLHTVTAYRDSLQFVHDQTLRYMNKGDHPEDISRRLGLPSQLVKQEPYLLEHYCTLSWAARVVFDKYLGWFSGSVEELSAYTSREEAKRLVKLGGGVTKVLTKAQDALLQGDYQWALELASAVLHVERGHSMATDMKRQALKNLADAQSSLYAKNYLLASSMTWEDTTVPRPQNFALLLPLEQLLRLMSTWVRAGGVCDTVRLQLTLHFTDVHRTFLLHLRNAIIELREEKVPPPSNTFEVRKYPGTKEDTAIFLSSQLWREVLGGLKPHTVLLSNNNNSAGEEVTVTRNASNIIAQLFSCLELMEPNFDLGLF